MRASPRKRVFAGRQVHALRTRLRIGQAALAGDLGISVSYLSQIESGDRPLTPKVLAALAHAFPRDWSDVDFADDTTLATAALAAATDPEIALEPLDQAAILRAVRQQPLLARRMVQIHTAYQQAREQLASLNDVIDTGSHVGAPLPWEAVRDWFHDVGNYIDPIDQAAEQVAAELGLPDRDSGDQIAERLLRHHGVDIVVPAEDFRPLKTFDPVGRTLTLSRTLSAESRAFLLAEQLGRIEFHDVMAAVISRSRLRDGEATKLLGAGLANYAAGALLMPYNAFRQQARTVRHDIDRLCRIFRVSFEQACHRLSTLQRPGAQGISFFFCRVDLAGNITKRHSATRLQFARFGGACPLWSVHEAAAIPDRIMVQLVEMPDATRYVSMAKGIVKPSGNFNQLSRRYAVVLGCEIDHAGQFVYADHIGDQATMIGVSCRICVRYDCSQRAFPPAGREILIDPNLRNIVPYAMR